MPSVGNRYFLVGIACFGIGLFVAALAFPAVGTCSSDVARRDGTINWFDNSNIALFGWLAALVGQLGWFANIPFARAALDLMKGRTPKWWIIAIQFVFLLAAVLTLKQGMNLPHNEAYAEPVCALGPGFWLWVVAQSVVLVGSISAQVKKRLGSYVTD